MNLLFKTFPNTWDLFTKLSTEISIWMSQYISNSAKLKLNSWCFPTHCSPAPTWPLTASLNPIDSHSTLPFVQDKNVQSSFSYGYIQSVRKSWFVFFFSLTYIQNQNLIVPHSFCCYYSAPIQWMITTGLVREPPVPMPNPNKTRKSIADRTSFYLIGQITAFISCFSFPRNSPVAPYTKPTKIYIIYPHFTSLMLLRHHSNQFPFVYSTPATVISLLFLKYASKHPAYSFCMVSSTWNIRPLDIHITNTSHLS